MNGKIVPDYYITCGICEYGQHAGSHILKEAERHARLDGWKKTRAHGWICSDCAKKATKEPA